MVKFRSTKERKDVKPPSLDGIKYRPISEATQAPYEPKSSTIAGRKIIMARELGIDLEEEEKKEKLAEARAKALKLPKLDLEKIRNSSSKYDQYTEYLSKEEVSANNKQAHIDAGLQEESKKEVKLPFFNNTSQDGKPKATMSGTRKSIGSQSQNPIEEKRASLSGKTDPYDQRTLKTNASNALMADGGRQGNGENIKDNPLNKTIGALISGTANMGSNLLSTGLDKGDQSVILASEKAKDGQVQQRDDYMNIGLDKQGSVADKYGVKQKEEVKADIPGMEGYTKNITKRAEEIIENPTKTQSETVKFLDDTYTKYNPIDENSGFWEKAIYGTIQSVPQIVATSIVAGGIGNVFVVGSAGTSLAVKLTEKAVKSIPFFTAAYAGSYQEAREMGMDDTTASKYAVLSSGIETTTEMLFVPKKLKSIMGVSTGEVTQQGFKAWAMNTLKEGGTEALNEPLQAIMKGSIFGIDSEPEDIAMNTLQSFVGGMLMGGVFDAGTLKSGKQFKVTGDNGDTYQVQTEDGKTENVSKEVVHNFMIEEIKRESKVLEGYEPPAIIKPKKEVDPTMPLEAPKSSVEQSKIETDNSTPKEVEAITAPLNEQKEVSGKTKGDNVQNVISKYTDDIANGQRQLETAERVGNKELKESATSLLKETNDKMNAELRSLEVEKVSDDVEVKAIKEVAKRNATNIESLNVSEIGVDPKRFQFKADVDAKSGAGNQLEGTDTFNSDYAGTIQVWRDKNGKDWVINGHHRVELARRAGAKNINAKIFYETDGIDPSRARQIAAEQNIAEGNGTSKDAALIFRETGYDKKDLAALGLSIKNKFIEQAYNISKLNDRIWDYVVSKKLKENQASMIGETFPDDSDKQNAVMDYINEEGSVTDAELKEVIDGIRFSETNYEEQYTLMGLETVAKSNFKEKVKLTTKIKQSIGSEKSAFGKLVKAQSAKKIEDAGNILNKEANTERLDLLQNINEIIDFGKNREGDPINIILNKYANEVQNGGKMNVAVDRAIEDITDIVQDGGYLKLAMKGMKEQSNEQTMIGEELNETQQNEPRNVEGIDTDSERAEIEGQGSLFDTAETEVAKPKEVETVSKKDDIIESKTIEKDSNMKPEKTEVFYVSGQGLYGKDANAETEVIRNPSEKMKSQLIAESKELAKQGQAENAGFKTNNPYDELIRITYDVNGNEYWWKAVDSIHGPVESYIEKNYNTMVDKNSEFEMKYGYDETQKAKGLEVDTSKDGETFTIEADNLSGDMADAGIVINPSERQKSIMLREARALDENGNLDSDLIGTTYDVNGNEYMWKMADAYDIDSVEESINESRKTLTARDKDFDSRYDEDEIASYKKVKPIVKKVEAPKINDNKTITPKNMETRQTAESKLDNMIKNKLIDSTKNRSVAEALNKQIVDLGGKDRANDFKKVEAPKVKKAEKIVVESDTMQTNNMTSSDEASDVLYPGEGDRVFKTSQTKKTLMESDKVDQVMKDRVIADDPMLYETMKIRDVTMETYTEVKQKGYDPAYREVVAKYEQGEKFNGKYNQSTLQSLMKENQRLRRQFKDNGYYQEQFELLTKIYKEAGTEEAQGLVMRKEMADTAIGKVLEAQKVIEDSKTKQHKELEERLDKIMTDVFNETLELDENGNVKPDAEFDEVLLKVKKSFGLSNAWVKMLRQSLDDGTLSKVKMKEIIKEKMGIPMLKVAEIDKITVIMDKIDKLNPDSETYAEDKQAILNEATMFYRNKDVTFWTKVSSYQTMAMLMNIKTTLRNEIGNAMGFTTSQFDDVYSFFFDTALSKVTNARGTYNPRNPLKLKYKDGVIKSLEAYGNYLVDATENKYVKRRVFTPGSFRGKMEGVMGVMLSDARWKQPRVQFLLEQIAATEKYAKERGLDYDAETAKMKENINFIADYDTFNFNSKPAQALDGVVKAMNKIGNKDFGLGTLFAKFAKTPMNIIQYQLDHLGYDLFREGVKLSKLSKSVGFENALKLRQGKVSRALGKTATGMSYVVLGSVLSGLGGFVEEEEDKDVKNILEAQGIKGGYFNFSALRRSLTSNKPSSYEDGDTVISVNWMLPVAPFLLLGSRFANAKDEKESQGIADTFQSLIEAGGASMEDFAELPFNRTLGILTNSYDSGMDKANKLVGGTVTGFVPSVVKQLAQGIDPTSKRYSKNTGEAVVQQIKATLPGFRNAVPNRFNVTGKTETMTDNEYMAIDIFEMFTNPAYRDTVAFDKDLQEVMELNKKVTLPSLPKITRDNFSYNSTNYKMTQEEHQEFQKKYWNAYKESFKRKDDGEYTNAHDYASNKAKIWYLQSQKIKFATTSSGKLK